MSDELRSALDHAVVSILAVGVPLVVLWLRGLMQDLAIRRAVREADDVSDRQGLPHDRAEELARLLVQERVRGLWTGRPSRHKVEAAVTREMPKAAARRRKRSDPPRGEA